MHNNIILTEFVPIADTYLSLFSLLSNRFQKKKKKKKKKKKTPKKEFKIKGEKVAFAEPKYSAKQEDLSDYLNQVKGYSKAKIYDLTSIGQNLASSDPELGPKYIELKKEIAKEITDESELAGRYADYQDAFVGMATSSDLLKNITSHLNSDLDKSNGGWIDSIKSIIRRIRDTVNGILKRIFGEFESIYKGLNSFSKDLSSLLKEIASKSKDKIIAAIHKTIQSLSSIAVRIISTFFGWLASVKKIAAEKGFKLEEINVKMSPISMDKVDLFGFSIPIPKIPSPEVNMKFK